MIFITNSLYLHCYAICLLFFYLLNNKIDYKRDIVPLLVCQNINYVKAEVAINSLVFVVIQRCVHFSICQRMYVCVLCRISDLGVRRLAEGLCSGRLRELNLTNCVRVGDVGLLNLQKRCVRYSVSARPPPVYCCDAYTQCCATRCNRMVDRNLSVIFTFSYVKEKSAIFPT